MSYEGREFFLCEDGHLTILDSSTSTNLGENCFAVNCTARFYRQASVDDTNGDGREPRTEIIMPEQTCQCCDCRNIHTTKEAIHRPLDRTEWQTLDSSRQESKNERWKLEKGGEQILTGTYAECMLWLTRHCPHPILQSALERGYHIEPTTVGGNPPCKSVSS